MLVLTQKVLMLHCFRPNRYSSRAASPPKTTQEEGYKWISSNKVTPTSVAELLTDLGEGEIN